MIREMKHEALQLLEGKWGLGVGGTILFYILYFVMAFIIIIPFMIVIFLGIKVLGGFEVEATSTSGFAFFIIIYAVLMLLGFAGSGVMRYGYANMCLQMSRRNATIGALFEGFRGFKTMMKAMKSTTLIFLYTGEWFLILLPEILEFFVEKNSSVADSLTSLGFVLLLISLIIIAIRYLSYTMTYFIMLDQPEYGVLQAMKASKVMMKGHKMSLFLLWLSFIGWGILSMIPFLWLRFIDSDILAIILFGIGVMCLYPYMGTTTAAFYNKISEN